MVLNTGQHVCRKDHATGPVHKRHQKPNLVVTLPHLPRAIADGDEVDVFGHDGAGVVGLVVPQPEGPVRLQNPPEPVPKELTLLFFLPARLDALDALPDVAHTMPVVLAHFRIDRHTHLDHLSVEEERPHDVDDQQHGDQAPGAEGQKEQEHIRHREHEHKARTLEEQCDEYRLGLLLPLVHVGHGQDVPFPQVLPHGLLQEQLRGPVLELAPVDSQDVLTTGVGHVVRPLHDHSEHVQRTQNHHNRLAIMRHEGINQPANQERLSGEEREAHRHPEQHLLGPGASFIVDELAPDPRVDTPGLLHFTQVLGVALRNHTSVFRIRHLNSSVL